ncbi:MAG TPA: pilin, partial [Steroidobacter sp.]
PKFVRFDLTGASRRSWNWSAFFVTLPWMLYRRMYGLALVYLICSQLLPRLVTIVLVGDGLWVGLTYWALYGTVAFVLTPMYANALYHRHIVKRIAAATRVVSSHEVVVDRLRRQSTARLWPALMIASSVIGVLAAITIPAYQDYTVRSQVAEGLYLAASAKAMVAESYLSTNRWPVNLEEAGGNAAQMSGKYVESITVRAGVVLIRFGGEADSEILGKTLALRPSWRDESIVWSCGYNSVADERAVAEDTTIEERYLPAQCRASPSGPTP